MMKRYNYNIKSNVLCVFILLMLTLTVLSFYFGLSPIDESYYVSLPYRFILGDHPFVNEYGIQQTASLFTLPFFKVYFYLKGSMEGVVLFSRYLYFGFTLLLAFLIVCAFKKITNVWEAILMAMPYIIFAPGNIHGLSYNTLAILFSTAGYMFGLLGIFRVQGSGQFNEKINSSDIWIFVSGLFHAFVVISYPTLLVLPVIYFFCLSYFIPKKRVFLVYGFGLFVGLIGFIVDLMRVGVGQLLIDLHYDREFSAELGGIAKVVLILKQYWITFPQKIMVSILLGLALLLRKFRLVPTFILLLIITIFFIAALNDNFLAVGAFITNIFFITPILFLLAKNFNVNSTTKLFILIYIPSLISGLVTSWTSANGGMNNIIGFFPGVLVSIYYMMLIAKLSFKERIDFFSIKEETISLVFPIFFLVVLQYCNFAYPYTDGSLFQLRFKVENGPFKGIYTTFEKKQYYTQLKKDLDNFSLSSGRILFFDFFPAGYLFSDMKPAAPSTWLSSSVSSFPLESRQGIFDYYKMNNIRPNIIVKMLYVPGLPNSLFRESKDDPLNKLIAKYQLVLKRNGYEIYTQRSPK